MGVRSDIEEIQIEESVNTGTDEDSNQGSERQLRTRNKQKKKGGRQGKLIDKERQEFLSDFERNPSEREKRKLKKKTNYKDSARGKFHGKSGKCVPFRCLQTFFFDFQGVTKTMCTTRKAFLSVVEKTCVIAWMIPVQVVIFHAQSADQTSAEMSVDRIENGCLRV